MNHCCCWLKCLLRLGTLVCEGASCVLDQILLGDRVWLRPAGGHSMQLRLFLVLP